MPLDRQTHIWTPPDGIRLCEAPLLHLKGKLQDRCGDIAIHLTRVGWLCDKHWLDWWSEEVIEE